MAFKADFRGSGDPVEGNFFRTGPKSKIYVDD